MNVMEWFLNLGEQYGVDPIVFGAIYLGAVPFFLTSVGWLVRNIRRRRPIFLPILSTGFFFLSAYIYLLLVGHGIPLWVYLVVVLLVAYGVYTTVQRIKKKLT